MKHRKAWHLVVALVAALLMLPAGCGEEQEPARENNPPALLLSRWQELMKVIPANNSTLKAAYFQDISYLEQKIEQYPQTSLNYTMALYSIRSMSLFGQSLRYYNDEDWKRILGFVIDDVDQTASAPYSPPVDYYEAVNGRFNRKDIDNAVKTDPSSALLEVVSYAGHEFYSWGADHEITLSMRSNVRPLGRAMRLANIDDFIFWTATTQNMKEMIDSYEDNIESLSDVADYQLVTQGLSELDTVTAFLSKEAHSYRKIKEDFEKRGGNETARYQEFMAELDRPVRLKPFQALSTGYGIDGKGDYLAIVLLNPNEGVAQENAALLERRLGEAKIVWSNAGRPWTEVVESMEIESKGRLTLAKLYGKVWVSWDDFEVEMRGGLPYEPLLVHE